MLERNAVNAEHNVVVVAGDQLSRQQPDGQARKPSVDELRSAYFEPNAENNIARIQALLESEGFKVIRSFGDGEITAISWQNMEQDFESFDLIFQVISQATDLTDAQFNRLLVPRMQSIALGLENRRGSYLFQGLNSDNIQTTQAHTKTPFAHTIDVVRNATTEGLTAGQKDWVRMLNFVHDIGKYIIANNDHFQDHAEIGFLIMREYCRKHTEMSAAEIDQFLAPIRYHHTFELVDKGVLTIDEVWDLVDSPKAMVVLSTLAFADVQSVSESYMMYAINHGITALELFSEKLSEAEAELLEWLETFSQGFIEFLTKLDLEQTERSMKYVQAMQERVEQLSNQSFSSSQDALSQALGGVFKQPQAMVH